MEKNNIEILENELSLAKNGEKTRENLVQYTFFTEKQNEIINSLPYIGSSRDREDAHMSWRYASDKAELFKLALSKRDKNEDKRKDLKKEIMLIEGLDYDLSGVKMSLKEIIEYVSNLEKLSKTEFADAYVYNATKKLKCLNESDFVASQFGE